MRVWRSLAARMVGLSLTAAVAAQQATSAEVEELKHEIEALKEGQAEIQKSLDAITRLLGQRQPGQRNAPPPNVAFDLSSRPVRGASTARLAMIEFLDYQ